MRSVAVQLLEFKNVSIAGAFLVVGAMASLHPFSFLPTFSWGGEENIAFSLAAMRSPAAENQAISRFLKSRFKREKAASIDRLARIIREEARAHNLSPAIILSLIECESSFRAGVVSNRRAFGLMQVRFPTALEIAKRHKLKGFNSRTQLLDPIWNIKIGVRYLAELRNRFGGIDHALGAYNLGPRKYRENQRSLRPQPTQVREYIEEILTLQSSYEKSHGLARVPACGAGAPCSKTL